MNKRQLVDLIIGKLSEESYNPDFRKVEPEYLEPYPESIIKYDLAALNWNQKARLMTGVTTLESPYYDPRCPNDNEDTLSDPHPVRFETAMPITNREKWYCRLCKDHFLITYKVEPE